MLFPWSKTCLACLTAVMKALGSDAAEPIRTCHQMLSSEIRGKAD
jgi:hypothetical protein